MAESIQTEKNISFAQPPDPSVAPSRRCCVAVDLTPLRPDGANGGHRIAIFSFLEEIHALFPGKFRFLYLTSTKSHHELKEFEKDKDESLCVLDLGSPETGPKPMVLSSRRALHFYRRAGVDVFYCPFGDMHRVPPEYPVISWIADVLHRDYPGRLTKQEEDWREAYYRLVTAGADRIQVNSQYTAGSLRRHYAVDPTHLFTTYLAPRRLDKSRISPHQTPYFFYPANFWAHKNHETLLVAYAHYLATTRAPAWNMQLTGNADARMDYLQEVTRALGLGNHVHFRGFLRTEEFSEVAAAASALVFPSLYEGFGMPIAEAMLLGLPVIASDSGSIPEVGGDACHYVRATNPLAIAEAMNRLATDSNYRERLSAQGSRQVKKFSLARSATLLAKQLLEVAATSRDFNYRLRRRKIVGYGRLLKAKNSVQQNIQRLKAILSGT
jgi:glycosyltransferase involved in cell wall biosynthesis